MVIISKNLCPDILFYRDSTTENVLIPSFSSEVFICNYKYFDYCYVTIYISSYLYEICSLTWEAEIWFLFFLNLFVQRFHVNFTEDNFQYTSLMRKLIVYLLKALWCPLHVLQGQSHLHNDDFSQWNDEEQSILYLQCLANHPYLILVP